MVEPNRLTISPFNNNTLELTTLNIPIIVVKSILQGNPQTVRILGINLMIKMDKKSPSCKCTN